MLNNLSTRGVAFLIAGVVFFAIAIVGLLAYTVSLGAIARALEVIPPRIP